MFQSLIDLHQRKEEDGHTCCWINKAPTCHQISNWLQNYKDVFIIYKFFYLHNACPRPLWPGLNPLFLPPAEQWFILLQLISIPHVRRMSLLVSLLFEIWIVIIKVPHTNSVEQILSPRTGTTQKKIIIKAPCHKSLINMAVSE